MKAPARKHRIHGLLLWAAATAAAAVTAPSARADVGSLEAAGSWSVSGSEDPARTPLSGRLVLTAAGAAREYAVGGAVAWEGGARCPATGTARVVARTMQLTLTLTPEPGAAVPAATAGGSAGGAADALDRAGGAATTGEAGSTGDANSAGGAALENGGAVARAPVPPEVAPPVTLSATLSLLRDGRTKVLQGRWKIGTRTGLLRLTRSHAESFADFVARSWEKIDFSQYGYMKDGRIEVDCADAFLILVSLYAQDQELDLLFASGTPLKTFRLSTYLKKFGPDGIKRFTAQVCAWFGTFNLPDFAENLGGNWRDAQVGDVLFKPAHYENGMAFMGHTTLRVGTWTRAELEQEVPEGSAYRADLEAGIRSGVMKPYLAFKILASTVGWSGPRIKEVDARNRYIGNDNPEMNYLKEIRRVRGGLFSERSGTP